jgi:hypothetical protein
MKLAEKLDDQKKQNRAYVEVRPSCPSPLPSTILVASSSCNFPVFTYPDLCLSREPETDITAIQSPRT